MNATAYAASVDCHGPASVGPPGSADPAADRGPGVGSGVDSDVDSDAGSDADSDVGSDGGAGGDAGLAEEPGAEAVHRP